MSKTTVNINIIIKDCISLYINKINLSLHDYYVSLTENLRKASIKLFGIK